MIYQIITKDGILMGIRSRKDQAIDLAKHFKCQLWALPSPDDDSPSHVVDIEPMEPALIEDYS